MSKLLTPRKLTLSLLVLLFLIATVLAGCSNNNNANESPQVNDVKTDTPADTQTDTPAEPAKPQEFRFTLASEPPSLDPALMTDAQSGIVANGIYEGLMRLDSAGEPQYAIASEYSVSSDGKVYTFKLRDDAKWSNGDPVTANDFVYAWTRALNPATAGDYAYILYYLENAQQYNAGEITDASQVGVKAIDDYTLEVKLNAAAPYFPSLVSHYTFFPVHKPSTEGKPDWAAEASTIVTNGPFLLSEWKHEDRLVLTKNPNYHEADKVNFTTVTITLVEDDNTVYNLFETDEIDWIGAQAGSVVSDLVPSLVAEGKAEIKTIASTYYFNFNNKKAPFDNAKIRKAFSMSINRQDIIDNVTQANQTPAYGMVPPSIAGIDGKNFREIYPDNFYTENVEEAKKLLAEGMAESGLTALPEIELIYNTSEGHKKIAEATADMWRQNLGVEVKLSNMEWGTFLEIRSAGQYDIARSGWGADFNHAMSFTYDLIHPDSGNNDSKYDNDVVRKLLDDAVLATDEHDRLAKLAEAEKIAIGDEVGNMPIYYYTTVTMVKDGIDGVVSDYAGHIDYVFGSKK